MDYVKLGSSGLDISPVCLGCMGFGEPGRGYPAWSLSEADAQPLIRQALEAGVNFLDTANGYSDGSSEEIVGRAVREFGNRHELVIATKVYHPMRPGPNAKGLSRKAIMTEIDASLIRLGTDYIDLYQIHRIDDTVPLEETLEALHDVVKSGKARYIGASSMHAWQFAKALHLQLQHGWTRFVSMQDHYSLLNREEEREMLPLCADAKIGVMPWSPLARGRLVRDRDQITPRSATSDVFGQTLYRQRDAEQAIADAVAAIAAERGISRAQVALAWVSRHPAVSAPIVGVTKPHHVDDAIASLDVQLTGDEVARLEAPYAPQPPAGFSTTIR